MDITIFYIPTGSETEASTLGEQLVGMRLAACANIFPIQSAYHWQGTLHNDHEFVVILKTIPALAARLKKAVEERHSYQVPAIVSWRAEVNDAYGIWMLEQLLDAME